ncbi:hypothetical protein Tco_1532285 [Tanacetum coccineum]
MDYDQLFAEFNVWAACQTYLSAKVMLWSEHNLRERKKFERKYARQTDLLKEKDAEIANLKSQLSLKEAKAAEAICLRSQVSIVKATKAARVNELNNLKEWNLALEGEKSTLEGQVATLESATASKDTELASVNTQVAKLNHDLYSLQLSCDELIIKAASLESQKDSLTDQYEVVQDEQVKILSDRVAELDSELMGMAVHLDKEFLSSLPDHHNRRETGLVAGIDHGKAKRGLTEVAAYDPSVEERDVFIVLAFNSLRLEGPSAETPEVKESALSHRLSIYEEMAPLVDHLSSENLVVEASTSGVRATATTTTTLSVSVTTTNVSSIPPISVADYEVLNAKPRSKASHSPKIIFEQETLETSPEHPTTS